MAYDWSHSSFGIVGTNGQPGTTDGPPGTLMDMVDGVVGVDEVDACIVTDPEYPDNSTLRENGFDSTILNGHSITTLPYLKQYHLVFLIHARDIKDSLFDCIYENLLPEDFSVNKEDFHDYVIKHQKEILFIIDGYDEMTNLHNQVLTKLVQKHIMPHCTVLLTSRPQHALSLLKYFDSHFLVKGYSGAHMSEFISKYAATLDLPLTTFVDLLKRLDSYSSLKDVCRNPLNLIFMCILCEEKQGILPYTRTEIYEEIIELLKQKASVRLDRPLKDFQDTLNDICRIAFEGLKENVFSFNSKLFKSEKLSASLGFLAKEVPTSRLRMINSYTFTHKSFQEFFAAKHVTSLPKKQRQQLLDSCLRNRFMSTVWIFYSGLNRRNEDTLVQFVKSLNNQSCPITVYSSPVKGSSNSHKSALRIPRNVPFREMSVQDLKGGIDILRFKCVKEMDMRHATMTLIDQVRQGVPKQITFFYPFTSKNAIQGFRNFLKASRITDQYSLIISSQFFDNQPEYEPMIKRFETIATTGHICSIGLHDVIHVRQLITAINTFFLDRTYSSVKCLQLKFISVITACSEAMQKIKFGPRLEHIEIYNCNNQLIVITLLKEIVRGCKDLTSLVIHNCTVDDEGLLTVGDCIRRLPKLVHFDFTLNNIQSDSELGVLPILVALNEKSKDLKSLSISGLHTNKHSICHIETSSEITNLLRQILENSNLQHFHISKSAMLKSTLDTFRCLGHSKFLTSLEIVDCLISNAESVKAMLRQLKNMPKLSHLNFRGSSIRAMTDVQVFSLYLNPEKLPVPGMSSPVPDVGPVGRPSDESEVFKSPLPAEHPDSVLKTPPSASMDDSDIYPPEFRPRSNTDPRFRSAHAKILPEPKDPERRPSRSPDKTPPALKLRRRFKSGPRLTLAIDKDKPTLKRVKSVPDGIQDKITLARKNDGRRDDRTESIIILHELLPVTKTLTSLIISDLHADHLICLCKGLRENKTLISLSLRATNLAEGCTDALCSFLKKHPTLQEFSMARSNLNGLEMAPFLHAIAKCKPMQILGLNHCLFHDKHMPMLAKALKENLSICHAILRDNSRVTQEGIMDLYEGLKGRKKWLQSIDLSDCRVTKNDRVTELLKEVSLVVKVNWF